MFKAQVFRLLLADTLVTNVTLPINSDDDDDPLQIDSKHNPISLVQALLFSLQTNVSFYLAFMPSPTLNLISNFWFITFGASFYQLINYM